MSGGRPTDYDPKYCDELVAHMASGLSYESFAGVIGVARSTLYEWEKHQEFSDAKSIGVEKGRLFWEKRGIAAMSGSVVPGFDHKKFNVTAWIFGMKNRFGWRDRTELSGDPEKPVRTITETRPMKDEPTESLHEAILRLTPAASEAIQAIARKPSKKKPKRKAK